jgi:hypothetical protein
MVQEFVARRYVLRASAYVTGKRDNVAIVGVYVFKRLADVPFEIEDDPDIAVDCCCSVFAPHEFLAHALQNCDHTDLLSL